MSKFITLNQYMYDSKTGDRVETYDDTREVNIDNIVDLEVVEFKEGKYLLQIVLVNGKTLKIYTDGAPYNTMADAIVAKDNLAGDLSAQASDSESLVESGYYDEVANELVLVLADSSEIRIPVDNLLTDLDAHNIRFNGSGTNYLTTETEVESAVKELDTRVKANTDNVALKVNTSDIVDNLESTDVDKPLSANQGKVLQDTKANIAQEAWITPTLTDATTTYLKYRKDTLGSVIVEGNITVTTAGTHFTLPTGYRPLFDYTVGILTFNEDGTVVSSETGEQSLSIRFTGGA